MEYRVRCFHGLLFAHLICLVNGIVSWGNKPIPRPNDDQTSYAVLLPDPDMAASDSGYLFRTTMHVTSATDSFRIAILRPRSNSDRQSRSYVVTAISDFLAFHKATMDATMDADPAPETVYLPAPLPYSAGDHLAFVVGARVPCPYTVEDPCRFYSRYQTAANFGRLQAGSLVNTTRSPECRRYSYVVDGISSGSIPKECIPVTFGNDEGRITKKIGTLHAETIYRDFNATNHTDICWHVTCSSGLTLVLSVIYYNIDNNSQLEISHSKNSEPVLQLTGVISSDTPYQTTRGSSLYIWYRAEQNKGVQSGFETAVYVEEDSGESFNRELLVTICLAVIAGIVLLVAGAMTVLRCRERCSAKSTAAPNTDTSEKPQEMRSRSKKKKKKNSNHNDVERGYDNIISPGGSEIENKIPRIGYKADNTFLKGVGLPQTSLDRQLQDSQSLESLDIEASRSEFEVLDALEAAIRGAAGSMAPSTEGSLAGELEKAEPEKVDNVEEPVDSGVANVERDVAKVENDEAKVESDVAEVESDVAKVENDEAKVESYVAKVESDVTKVENDEANVESYVTK